MRYDDFTGRLTAAREDWRQGRLNGVAARGELAKLRGLLGELEPDQARFADYALGEWAEELSPAAPARLAAARLVMDRVMNTPGTPAELIASARQGIEEIDRIAAGAPYPDEQDTLLGLCEPLEALIEELEVQV